MCKAFCINLKKQNKQSFLYDFQSFKHFSLRKIPSFHLISWCGNFVVRQNYAETVPFHKIPTPGNQVKLRYFSQCLILRQSEAVFRVYRYLHILFLTYQITMFSENTQHFFNVSIYFFSFTLDSLTYFKQMFPFHTL